VKPGKFIVMGRVLAPFGIKGWVKVENYSDSLESLLPGRDWWLGRDGEWEKVQVAGTERHGSRMVARFEGCDSPESAVAYRGREIALTRDSLPPVAQDEFYQADLIGLEVRNMQDEPLGRLTELFSNGAHEIMRVAGAEGERLLPYIPQVVQEIDIGAGRIRVDWGKDW
jgi:16S rRNA processing protein RimM